MRFKDNIRHAWPKFLKFEASVQIYLRVWNIGREIQNSGGNDVNSLKIFI